MPLQKTLNNECDDAIPGKIVITKIAVPYAKASFCDISESFRKYSNKYFNKYGTINGATTSKMKLRIPINRYSGQNVFTIAFKSDGFDFLSHSSRHFLSHNEINFCFQLY